MDKQLKFREWITLEEATSTLTSIFGEWTHPKEIVQYIAEGSLRVYWYIREGSTAKVVEYGTLPNFEEILNDSSYEFTKTASQDFKAWMPISRETYQISGPLKIELDINPIFRDCLTFLHRGDIKVAPAVLLKDKINDNYYWVETRKPKADEVKFPNDGVILSKSGICYQLQKWWEVEDDLCDWVPDWKFPKIHELRVSREEFEYRFLDLKKITPPSRSDDWYLCIRECIKEFEEEFKHTPIEAQLWNRLIKFPPKGWGVEPIEKTIKGKVITTLYLPGKPLDREAFHKRFEGYYPLLVFHLGCQ